MFVLFIVLIVGPIVASKFVSFKLDVMELQQPSDWNNNDTSASDTGTAVAGGASATASAGARLVRKMMFSYDS